MSIEHPYTSNIQPMHEAVKLYADQQWVELARVCERALCQFPDLSAAKRDCIEGILRCAKQHIDQDD